MGDMAVVMVNVTLTTNLKVRQNVLDMTLHISQYSNIISDLKEEIKK